LIDEKPFLSVGFRPFFFAAVWAATLLPTFWISIYFGYIDYHGLLLTPASWHSHEMIFGFVPALIAGFLLTASANWTGKDPISGKPLLFLFSLWLLERVLFLLPLSAPYSIASGLVFLLPFTFVMANYLKNHPKQQFVFVPFFLLLTTAKVMMLIGSHYKNQFLYIGQELGLDLIRLILIIISGRVLPFFIKMKFPELKIPTPAWIKIATAVSVLILCLPLKWHTMPILGMGVYSFAILTTSIQFLLLKPWRSSKEPMIAILLVGYLWIIINLIIEIVVLQNSSMAFGHPNIHALTAGAVGCMGAGIIVRVTLGHTGREVKADKMTLVIFACIFSGALIRVFVPLFEPAGFMKSIHHASGWWTLGFMFLALKFTKVFFKARL